MATTIMGSRYSSFLYGSSDSTALLKRSPRRHISSASTNKISPATKTRPSSPEQSAQNQHTDGKQKNRKNNNQSSRFCNGTIHPVPSLNKIFFLCPQKSLILLTYIIIRQKITLVIRHSKRLCICNHFIPILFVFCIDRI